MTVQSIASRLVLGNFLVLAVFVALVAVSVSYSVYQRAETARYDRMQGLIYGILGATEIDDRAQLSVNELALPDSRLNQSNTGLYAELIGFDGSTLWRSTSSTAWVPDVVLRPFGDWLFETVDHPDKRSLHRLQFSLAWALDNGEEVPFTVHVVDTAESLERQLSRFDQSLWATLLASAALLLLVQFFVLRQSLKPLNQISEQVTEIESGSRQLISDQVPRELEPLTRGLNALLAAERERHTQYRHLLDDLAHNLKTPISVLRNLKQPIVTEQTERMNQSIDRYCVRARMRSPKYLASATAVQPVVERIARSLEKLFGSPQVRFDIDLNPGLQVRMDQADLYEVLGNLMENACKYGATKISVHETADIENVSSPAQTPNTNTGSGKHVVIIDDNGPGFGVGKLDPLTERGVRADTQQAGSGTGLASSAQLMGSYGGNLELAHSPQGGARILLRFV